MTADDEVRAILDVLDGIEPDRLRSAGEHVQSLLTVLDRYPGHDPTITRRLVALADRLRAVLREPPTTSPEVPRDAIGPWQDLEGGSKRRPLPPAYGRSAAYVGPVTNRDGVIGWFWSVLLPLPDGNRYSAGGRALTADAACNEADKTIDGAYVRSL